jgi:flagellar basal body P-ring formation protein FlgA
MKRVANSLLTLHFCTVTRRSNRDPRENPRSHGRSRTPIHSSQKGIAGRSSFLLISPRPPRSLFRPRLGEGRVRNSFPKSLSALLALSIVCLLVTASAAQGPTVILKSEASLRPGTILLGDIAELRGPDQDRLEELSRISLGAVPSAGLIRRISVEQVREAVHKAGFPLETPVIGATAAEVRLQCRGLDSAELLPVIKAYILKSSSWQEDELSITSVNRFNGASEIPVGPVEFQISARAPLPRSRNLLLPVDVLLDGQAILTLWVSCEISIQANVLQASSRIPYGRALAEGDAHLAVMQVQDLSGSYVRQFEDVKGQVLRRTIMPGEPITHEVLTSPFLIRSGDTVRLRFEQDGISLATLVRAEQSGKLGQVIRVRNLDFMRSVKAQVVGPGEVKAQIDLK